jgi:MSHA biogenesis protein MshP
MSPKPNLNPRTSSSGEDGFSLVSAIFLLVIIAAIGVFSLSIYTMQRASASQDVRGVLAYQAAKAGIEWASYQILTPENVLVVNSIFPGCGMNMASVPSFAGALSGFLVRVDCQLTEADEGGNKIRVYQLTATASKGAMPSNDYVERQIFASFSTCRKGVAGLATDPPC